MYEIRDYTKKNTVLEKKVDVRVTLLQQVN